ncbi:ABC transporter permease [Patescibacteria group bacterium]|nr:ABC transporter permease [Patescibacteria group bacterium]
MGYINDLSGRRLSVLWAFVVKDLKQMFRFKTNIVNFVFAPMLTMFSFFLVYSSVFMQSGVDDLGFVQKQNYVVYLLTGFLAYSYFHMTWGKTKLKSEKMMQTLDGILLSPRSRLYILAGKGVKTFFEIIIVTLIFIAFMFFLTPSIIWINLFFGTVALMFIFIIFISFDFVISSIELSEEGIAAILVNYLPRAFLILGAVYFPIDIIPKWLWWLAYINPVYIGVNIFRSAFMEANIPLGIPISLLYIGALALLMPFFAIYVFDFVLKKWGVRGY